MFLESMILHNFRCFSDIEIKFNNQLTVVVGNNGAGKSTILEAATIAAGTLTAAMDGRGAEVLNLQKAEEGWHLQRSLHPLQKSIRRE